MKMFTVLILCIFSMLCNAQCEKNKVFDISLFSKSILQKKDTIYFKGTFISIGKVSQSDLLKKLSSKKIINSTLYASAIEFLPFGSDSSLYMPFNDEGREILSQLYNQQNKKKEICIEAIFIQGYEIIYSKPFFLINRIWFQ